MKIVLSGGGSCGKTSVINELAKLGFTTISETATEVLREMKQAETFDKQSEIFKRQLKKELSLPENKTIFLDRSLIDGIAYSKYLLEKMPFPDLDLSGAYDKIFILDRLHYEQNDIRIEGTDNEAQKLHDSVIQEYASQGYDIVTVPVMPIEERVKFILDRIKHS